MSQWTHVNASIRFDEIMNIGLLPTEKELGKICRWEDEDTSHWDNPDLPCGSEGSIDYKIIKNPDGSCMAAMVVVFFGDLRDYDNADEILNYFERVTKGKMIRSGVLEIDVESKDTLIYRYDSNKWVKCA
jgi:hypothetical protein